MKSLDKKKPNSNSSGLINNQPTNTGLVDKKKTKELEGKGIKINCPYCGKEAKWCENKEVYGKNYGKSYMCYWCKDCGAYVGCHNNTTKPLGTMANKELRDWRIKAHEMFDKLWKDGLVTRKEAYKILDDEFGKEIHIGESDIETCQRIISLLSK